MVTWIEVKEFLIKNYNVIREESERILIRLKCANDRRQEIRITKLDFDDGNIWVEIYSRVGNIPLSEFNNALSELSKNGYFGGFARDKDVYYIRHCVPINTLQENEISDPIELVAKTADAIERKFIGIDKF